MIKYKVTLAKEEHDQLMEIIDKGVHSSQQYRTAYILLNCLGDSSIQTTGKSSL